MSAGRSASNVAQRRRGEKERKKREKKNVENAFEDEHVPDDCDVYLKFARRRIKPHLRSLFSGTDCEFSRRDGTSQKTRFSMEVHSQCSSFLKSCAHRFLLLREQKKRRLEDEPRKEEEDPEEDEEEDDEDVR